MPVVVSCPKCDKKLAVKDELKGRPLVCPTCKARFSVPADDPPASDRLESRSAKASSTNGDMGFLDSLVAPAARQAKNGVAAPASTNGTPLAPKRAKRRASPMTAVAIVGGIAAAVLVVVAALIISNLGQGDEKTPAKDENIRFGLADSARHKLFSEMILAVDAKGITAECKQRWLRLAGDHKLDPSHLKDILDEGFARSDWDQPQLEVTQDQKQKANRLDWIRKRNETNRDPILAL